MVSAPRKNVPRQVFTTSSKPSFQQHAISTRQPHLHAAHALKTALFSESLLFLHPATPGVPIVRAAACLRFAFSPSPRAHSSPHIGIWPSAQHLLLSGRDEDAVYAILLVHRADYAARYCDASPRYHFHDEHQPSGFAPRRPQKLSTNQFASRGLVRQLARTSLCGGFVKDFNIKTGQDYHGFTSR